MTPRDAHYLSTLALAIALEAYLRTVFTASLCDSLPRSARTGFLQAVVRRGLLLGDRT